MRDGLSVEALTLPGIPVGALETPVDLTRLLYKGGAGTRVDKVLQAILDGRLGAPFEERRELVDSIHAVIAGSLAGGGSPVTARSQVKAVTLLFAWADKADAMLTKAGSLDIFLQWAEHLVHRWKVEKSITIKTAHKVASRVGQILDSVLERDRPVQHLTRLIPPTNRKVPLGRESEKQNLHGTFIFGQLLQDLCDGLPINVVMGSLNIQIPRASGGSVSVWTGGSATKREAEWEGWEVRDAEARRRAYANDCSLQHRGRKSVLNVRIMAELLMFIGQTGMNLSQAHKLRLRNFNYSSDIDGYKVRDYKNRRGGEVLFEIFSTYRSHFERYLEWRRKLFPDSDDLFPVIRSGSHKSRAPYFTSIIGLCKRAGVPWTPPKMLRGTRVNWLLRRSGDPDLTAEMAQHHKKVLLEVYEQPSLQRAIGEVTRFWIVNDPALCSAERLLATAPGTCDGKPVVSDVKPAQAPSPDCARPSGCLWCEHHRDIDTQDYVWSLVCFRHLKILEVSKHCFSADSERRAHPAQFAIDKLTQKLSWFKNSNAARREWVQEALIRVEEGNYHGEWERLINDLEGTDQ